MSVGEGKCSCAQFKLQLTPEDTISLFFSVGSSVLGRTLSHEASPTPPSVQSVVEPATSPLTASTPGDDHLINSQSSNLSVQWNQSFCDNVFSFFLCLARLLPTEQQAANLLSRPRTRLVWTRSICPSWLSWGRLRSPPLGEDTLAPREGLIELQDPTITSHHQ